MFRNYEQNAIYLSDIKFSNQSYNSILHLTVNVGLYLIIKIIYFMFIKGFYGSKFKVHETYHGHSVSITEILNDRYSLHNLHMYYICKNWSVNNLMQ